MRKYVTPILKKIRVGIVPNMVFLSDTTVRYELEQGWEDGVEEGEVWRGVWRGRQEGRKSTNELGGPIGSGYLLSCYKQNSTNRTSLPAVLL